MKPRALLLTLCLAASMAFAAAAEAPTNALGRFEASRNLYDKALVQLEDAMKKKIADAATEYATGLDLALEAFQKKGDLDGVLLIKNEKDRHQAQKTVPSPALKPDHTVIDRLAESYWKAAATAQADHKKSLLQLNKRYATILGDQVRELTRANEIESAKTVNNELKMIESLLASQQKELPAAAAPPPPEPLPAKTDSAIPLPLRKDLVLHYAFDRDEGAKVTDKSGKKNDGKVRGAQWTAEGKVGGACSFNGSSNGILIDDHASLDFKAGPRSIGAWIRCLGPTRDYQAIFGKGTNPGYALRLKAAQRPTLEYFKSSGAHYSMFTSTCSITDKRWHQIFAVDQGNGKVDFYIDGELADTVKRENHNSDSDGKAGVGACPDKTLWQVFNGELDEIMLFNRALTEREIKALFDSAR